MNRAWLAVVAGIVAVIAACSSPTEMCACPPSRTAVYVRGTLLARNGTPVPNARLGVDAVPRGNGAFDAMPVPAGGTILTTSDDGMFAGIVYSMFAPDSLHLRFAVLPEGSGAARPSTVLLARFRAERDRIDTVGVAVRLP